MPEQTRRAQFRMINTQQQEDHRLSQQLRSADYLVEPLKNRNSLDQCPGKRVLASLLHPPSRCDLNAGEADRKLVTNRFKVAADYHVRSLSLTPLRSDLRHSVMQAHLSVVETLNH